MKRNSWVSQNSHASALRAHGVPGATALTVYANQEQRPKPPTRGGLTQTAIDRAFSNGARVSQDVFDYRDAKLVLLAGKHTGNHRVAEIEHAGSGVRLPVTDLAGTLVDITVRPAFAGGPTSALEAYRHVVERVRLT